MQSSYSREIVKPHCTPPCAPPASDVLEGGEVGSEEGGGEGRGVWLGPPSSQGPPMVPTEGGPKIWKLKSSWHRRRRSNILAVSLEDWNGRKGGGQGVQRG